MRGLSLRPKCGNRMSSNPLCWRDTIASSACDSASLNQFGDERSLGWWSTSRNKLIVGCFLNLFSLAHELRVDLFLHSHFDLRVLHVLLHRFFLCNCLLGADCVRGKTSVFHQWRLKFGADNIGCKLSGWDLDVAARSSLR